MEALIPSNEAERLEALFGYKILDTEAEQGFDDITLLAAHICQTPIALVSLVDRYRQWFKSKIGLNATETCRDVAFCAHALLETDVFVIEDALEDERFRDNPLVVSDPNIRFYAGAPLITPQGLALGTLCVIDYAPRRITSAQKESLRMLARQVVSQLELRRHVSALAEAVSDRERAEAEVRKALEKEKELNELKTRFISMTSHEFRTPLSTILSSTELLEIYSHRWSEEKKIKHFDRIKLAIAQVTDLLNDVLIIGKAEAGKIELNPTRVNLENFCYELVEEMQLGAGNHHTISFISNSSTSESYIDEKILRQILSNLLLNALKYSPVGSQVHFKLECEKDEAIFHIQDNGIGIPEEDQLHLFETFYRASNVGNISGTGLGLAIVKKCVDLLEGKVMVSSHETSGTTFRVAIPFNLKAADELIETELC